MSLQNKIKTLWALRWALRSLPQTLYFNFHYLPWRQAIRLPILLYKPKLKAVRGSVRIEGVVKPGMIHLGENLVPLFPNDGVMFENNGGDIVFNGTCILGNSTKISVGPGARLEFGDRNSASAALKLACYKEITLHDKVRLGWDVTMFDCDFHKMTLLSGGHTDPYRRIEIGENCWIGYSCTILKGTFLPSFTTVSAKTVLNKRYDIPEYCVIGMDNTVKVKKEGVYRNLDDDSI